VSAVCTACRNRIFNDPDFASLSAALRPDHQQIDVRDPGLLARLRKHLTEQGAPECVLCGKDARTKGRDLADELTRIAVEFTGGVN
jgi:hypothetical protein